MELMLLRMFQQQVKNQCDVVLAAGNDLDAALDRLAQRDRTALPLVWIAIQNLLAGAANISKALWGQKHSKLEGPRHPLRESLQVDDDSPLRSVVIRNAFEHFDEKLDEWWRDSPNHNHIDMSIGPPGMIVMAPHMQLDVFRQFDPDSGELTFWGDKFNVREVVAEVQRIYPIVCEEAAKPHWDPDELPSRSTSGSGQPQRPS